MKVSPGRTSAFVALALTQAFALSAQERTAGLDSLPHARATGSSVLTAPDLDRVPGESIEQHLMGKVAGADIQGYDGAPGGGFQVTLRGTGTFFGDATPLYVVDGVITSDVAVNSGLNVITGSGDNFSGIQEGFATHQDNAPNRIADLNPGDIERIEVLKGAAAAAMYGSRASNGVILITTRRGTEGAPRFRMSQRLGTSDLSNKLGLRKIRSVEDAREAFGDLGAELWRPDAFFDHEEAIAGNHPLLYETSASVRGGTSRTRYFASGLVKHDGGVVTGTYYGKQGLRLNVDRTVGSRAWANLSLSGVHATTGRGVTNNDNRNISYWYAFPRAPTFIDLSRRADGTWPTNPFGDSNPLQTAALVENHESLWRTVGSVGGGVHVIGRDRHGLDVRASVGWDRFGVKNRIYSPPELQYERNRHNAGALYRSQTNIANWNADVSATHRWEPSRWDLHTTTAFGVKYERRSLDVVRNYETGLAPGQTNFDPNDDPAIFQTDRLIGGLGFFGRSEALLFGDRLFLSAGVRADRSDTNADRSEYFVYPMASGAYRIIDPVPGLVDELKVRGGWGRSGSLSSFGDEFSQLTDFIRRRRIRSALRVADDLHAERQSEVEGGLDALLFGRRALVEVTAYRRRLTDLLLVGIVPVGAGNAPHLSNGGAMTSRGYEASIRVAPLNAADRSWVSRVTFSRHRTKVDSLLDPPFSPSGFGIFLGQPWLQEGMSATALFGAEATTVPDDPRCAGPCPVGTLVATPIGDTRPDFRMGFSNDVTVGSLRLYAALDWRHGGDALNVTQWLYQVLGPNAGDFDDPCVLDACLGGETLGEYRLRVFPFGNAGLLSQDASFVKLRELSVAYALPGSLVRRFWEGAESVSLTLSGRNLLTFTGYAGLDPEVSNFGAIGVGRNIDVAPYPPSRSFWFSVDVVF